MRRRFFLLGMAGGGAAIPWYLAAGINPDTIYGAYQLIGATDEAEALSNRHNPGTNDLTKVSTPTFSTATGMMCTAAKCLNTGWIPTLDDYFFMIRFSTEETANYYPVFGLIETNANIFILDEPGAPGDIDVEIKTLAGVGRSTPFMQTGVIGACVKGSYRDGSRFKVDNVARSSNTIAAWMGNVNNGGSVYASLPKKLYIEAAILCSSAPSNTAILDLATKMAALPATGSYSSGAYSGYTCSVDKRFSIMGDSISLSTTDYWAKLARENLNQGKGYVRMLNHSVAGYTITSHMEGQAATIAGDNADYVIVLLGTNDTASSDYAGMLGHYKAAIDVYLANSPNLTASNIFCLGILNKTTPGNRTNINTQVIQQAAIDKGCTYVNTDGWSTEWSDGLHPTLADHARIMTAMAAVLP